MEPDVKDLMFMADDGKVAVGIYKGNVVRIGLNGLESFTAPAEAIYSMFKFWHAAGFKLDAPSQEMLDAQRYRYLRNLAGTGNDEDGPMVCSGSGDLFDYLRGADVDEQVDEAMLTHRTATLTKGECK